MFIGAGAINCDKSFDEAGVSNNSYFEILQKRKNALNKGMKSAVYQTAGLFFKGRETLGWIVQEARTAEVPAR